MYLRRFDENKGGQLTQFDSEARDITEGFKKRKQRQRNKNKKGNKDKNKGAEGQVIKGTGAQNQRGATSSNRKNKLNQQLMELQQSKALKDLQNDSSESLDF